MTEQAELNRPQSARQIEAVNPATGEPGRSYDETSLGDALAAAAAARQGIPRMAAHQLRRAIGIVHNAAAILRARKDEFARLMTEEMGKTLTDGRAEVEKCASHCDWFADHAHEYLADEPVDFGGEEAFVTFNPLGIVLAVMPWNFPFWQVFRAAAPALMAGNGMLLKHASNVPGCALAIEGVLHQAGVPHDLFRALLLPSREVEALIKDDNVAAVTLDRKRRRGKERRDRRRLSPQEMRARARRVRRLSRARGCRRRGGGDGRGDRADGERRAELHRRQALHRRPLDP